MQEELKRQLFEEVFSMHITEANRIIDGQPTPNGARVRLVIEAFWDATKANEELYTVLAQKKKDSVEASKLNAQMTLDKHDELLTVLDDGLAQAVAIQPK